MCMTETDHARLFSFIALSALVAAALACTTNADIPAVPGGPTGREVMTGEVYETNNLLGNTKQGFICKAETSSLYCSKKYVAMDFSEWDFDPKPSSRTSLGVNFDDGRSFAWQEVSWRGLLGDNTYGSVVITNKETLSQIKQEGFDLARFPPISLTCAKSVDSSKNTGVRCALSVRAPGQIEGQASGFFKCENQSARVSLVNDYIDTESKEKIRVSFKKDFPCN